jgi:hypothetical protein
MLVRTNFLWIGQLLADLFVVLTTVASLLYLLPYWAHADYASIDFGIYLFIGLPALWFPITLGWGWQKLQQRITTMIGHREQWLARWSYDQRTWQEYAQSERRRTYRHLAKWYAIFLLMGALIGIPWSQMFGQTSVIHLLLVVSVGLLVTFVQVTLVPYYRALNTAPEAFISTEGICIGGTVYFWEQAHSNFWQPSGLKIRSLTLVEGQPNTLEFKLYLRSGRSSSSPVVIVPIPAGCESQVMQVLAQLAPIN